MYQSLFPIRKSAFSVPLSSDCACHHSRTQAQFRTSIQGVVTDPTGAVIPGATLLSRTSPPVPLLRAPAAPTVFTISMRSPRIPFVLTAEKDGFQKKVLDHLQLTAQQPNGINIQLEAGGTSTTVTVSGDTISAIDTQTARSSRTISANEVQHIPVYERDPTSLIRLVPGVQADGAQQGGGGGFQAPEPRPEPHRVAAATWAFQQYLCYGKWCFGKCERWAI